MSEERTLVNLASFLKGFAKSQQVGGGKMVPPEEEGKTSWPKAIQYFPSNYAQLPSISTAGADLCAVSQKLIEKKRELAAKLSQTTCSCRNVHTLCRNRDPQSAHEQ